MIPQSTVSSLLAQWLHLHTLGRKPRAQEFNEEISAIVSRYWPGYLNAPARSITEDQFSTFTVRVTHYCPSRWNAIVSALQFITPLARSLQRRAIRPKERALLSPEEFEYLLTKLDARPRSHAGLMVRLLAYTGMRVNEARQLRWRDVKSDYLHVPGCITKSSEPRAIPFVRGVKETLDALRLVSPGETVLPQSECRRSLKSACVDAGIQRLSHHDFRHLFATRCIQSGVDLPTVARWLGHQDGGALLARTYFHLVDEHSRRMAARVVV